MDRVTDDFLEKHIVVDYLLEHTATFGDAAFDIAIGQSIANPGTRMPRFETKELIDRHAGKILYQGGEGTPAICREKRGYCKIAFPLINWNYTEDGVSHLLCVISGGQLDIRGLLAHQVLDIRLPKEVENYFRKLTERKMGVSGWRSRNPKAAGRPFLGTIVKPKVPVNHGTHLAVIEEMINGGADFLKEDEILSNPDYCPIERRIEAVEKLLLRYPHVVFCYTANADPSYLMDRLTRIVELGGRAVHVNVWSGLGVYKAIREKNLPLFVHYQKSGDLTFTNPHHRFSISNDVLIKVAGRFADSIHIGNFAKHGYAANTDEELTRWISLLHEYNTCPALSCGVTPLSARGIWESAGTADILISAGSAPVAHPLGVQAGTAALIQGLTGKHEAEFEAWSRSMKSAA